MSAAFPGPNRVSTFSAGDIKLENGNVFRDVKIVYEVHGRMNDDKSNVILHPTSYGAQHTDLRYRIGAGKNYTLDTNEYCVVVVNLLGNGASSSPSHANEGKGGLKVLDVLCRIC
jgi:homoserine O-acetyltransferase